MKTYNLELHDSSKQEKTFIKNMLYKVPEGTCKALKSRLEVALNKPGIFYKITEA